MDRNRVLPMLVVAALSVASVVLEQVPGYAGSTRQAIQSASRPWSDAAFCHDRKFNNANGNSSGSGISFDGVMPCAGGYSGDVFHVTHKGKRIYFFFWSDSDFDSRTSSWGCTEFAARYFYVRTGLASIRVGGGSHHRPYGNMPVWGSGRDLAGKIARIYHDNGYRAHDGRFDPATLREGAIISMWGGSGIAYVPMGHVAVVESVSDELPDGTREIKVIEQNPVGENTIVVKANGAMSYSDGFYRKFEWVGGPGLTR